MSDEVMSVIAVNASLDNPVNPVLPVELLILLSLPQSSVISV